MDFEYNIIKEITTYKEKYGDEKALAKYEQKILELNTPYLSCVFCLMFPNANVEAHSKVIINSKDDWWNLYFAKKFKTTNTLAHSEAVLRGKDPECNFEFAKHFKDSLDKTSIRLHGQIIIDSTHPYWNYAYALEFEDADILNHGQAVIQSKHAWWNYNFAKDINNADKILHAQLVIASGDKNCNHLFEHNMPIEYNIAKTQMSLAPTKTFVLKT